ncbi:VRR-NUC domain-containing protein [Aeribacillus sp. FSL K6-1305]|uniref:VRR-NUC domain-containing protein n=1 Tax=Aeribacillus sp. FSL K6-1305 TaxID=2954569 RepID=UPI0030FD761A
MRENAFQKKVTDFLKTQNVWFLKYWAGAYYTKQGVPDILACINGKFHGIELKTDTGNPTKLQLYNIRKIKEAGGEAYILRPKDFETWKAKWFNG